MNQNNNFGNYTKIKNEHDNGNEVEKVCIRLPSCNFLADTEGAVMY
jgi:hypothetical protein